MNSFPTIQHRAERVGVLWVAVAIGWFAWFNERSVEAQAEKTPEPSPAQMLATGTPADQDVYHGLDHTGTPDKPPPFDSPMAPNQGNAKDRKQPNYDGRAPEGVVARDVFVWIPRGLLYPVYLVLDYAVRWPLVNLIALSEEHYVPNRVVDFFTFADGKAMLVPTFFYDSTRGFWGGGNFFYNDLGREGHSLAVTGGGGTSGWYSIQLSDENVIFEDGGGTVWLKGGYGNDPSQVFTGRGPDTNIDDEYFFGERRGYVDTGIRVGLEALNRFEFNVGFRNVEIGEGRDPSVDDPASPFDPNSIPGFGEDYNLFVVGMRIVVDSRDPERTWNSGSGVRLDLFGSFQVDPGHTPLNFFRWGGEVHAFFDLSGINHVLNFSVYAETLDKTGVDLVPITELVTLGGGMEHLLAFGQGRFRGGSAFVMSVAYRYPVWSLLDAYLFASMGNVFGEGWDGFTFDKMVLNWGIGLLKFMSRQNAIGLLVGFGTNQFDRWDNPGFSLDNVRFAIGASHNF